MTKGCLVFIRLKLRSIICYNYKYKAKIQNRFGLFLLFCFCFFFFLFLERWFTKRLPNLLRLKLGIRLGCSVIMNPISSIHFIPWRQKFYISSKNLSEMNFQYSFRWEISHQDTQVIFQLYEILRVKKNKSFIFFKKN